MFILSLTYLKSNEEADKVMEAHMAWVAEGYDKGWFLASGRKVPRTGGVILATGDRQFRAHVRLRRHYFSPANGGTGDVTHLA